MVLVSKDMVSMVKINIEGIYVLFHSLVVAFVP